MEAQFRFVVDLCVHTFVMNSRLDSTRLDAVVITMLAHASHDTGSPDDGQNHMYARPPTPHALSATEVGAGEPPRLLAPGRASGRHRWRCASRRRWQRRRPVSLARCPRDGSRARKSVGDRVEDLLEHGREHADARMPAEGIHRSRRRCFGRRRRPRASSADR